MGDHVWSGLWLTRAERDEHEHWCEDRKCGTVLRGAGTDCDGDLTEHWRSDLLAATRRPREEQQRHEDR